MVIVSFLFPGIFASPDDQGRPNRVEDRSGPDEGRHVSGIIQPYPFPGRKRVFRRKGQARSSPEIDSLNSPQPKSIVPTNYITPARRSRKLGSLPPPVFEKRALRPEDRGKREREAQGDQGGGIPGQGTFVQKVFSVELAGQNHLIRMVKILTRMPTK
jgi:hypothetical protein